MDIILLYVRVLVAGSGKYDDMATDLFICVFFVFVMCDKLNVMYIFILLFYFLSFLCPKADELVYVKYVCICMYVSDTISDLMCVF